MRISEMLKHLEYQLETYGDADIHVDWELSKKGNEDYIHFERIIGNTIMTGLDKDNTEAEFKGGDGLHITNYPY